VNKSGPHDAQVLAQMARTGWFKEVRIKQEATHQTLHHRLPERSVVAILYGIDDHAKLVGHFAQLRGNRVYTCTGDPYSSPR
jgi:hypothetical protein